MGEDSLDEGAKSMFKSSSTETVASVTATDHGQTRMASVKREQFEIRWSRMNLLPAGSMLSNFIGKLLTGSDRGKSTVEEVELGSAASDRKSRPILNNVSGSVRSGELTAILGPSGVGKTTLLNALTGQTSNLRGSGRVSLVGGRPNQRLSVVMVPQYDVLPETLTAMEDLQFTSRLKNPQSGFDHQQNINRVVRYLQMDKFLNTRIGKLSGGEAKRLSIGRELLGSPNVLILDEPTSALDANTCKKVIGALGDIVEHSESYLGQPLSIIVTIHQPQREVLNLFHRCYVMAQGGRAIYQGPPSGIMADMLAHSSLPKACDPASLNENPAVVAIEVASGEFGPDIINQLATYHEVQCEGRNRQKKRFVGLRNRQTKKGSPADGVRVDERLRQGKTNRGHFVSQTSTLVERAWKLVLRNKFSLAINVIAYLLVGLGTVAFYHGSIDPKEHACPVYRSEVDDIKGYFELAKARLDNLLKVNTQSTNNFTLYFQLIKIITIIKAALVASVFPYQMKMLIREHRNGWYSPLSFLLSQAIAELPIDLLCPAILVATTYTACNQPESMYHWRQLCFLVVLFISTLVCKAQAQIVSALLMASVQMSVYGSCVSIMPFFLHSGLSVSTGRMAWPSPYLTHGSYLKYTFESFAMIRYGYGMCPCDESTVYGYPVQFDTSVLPKNLNRLAQEVLDSYETDTSINDTLATITTTTTSTISSLAPGMEGEEKPNVILKMLRLMTDASNLFVPEPEQLGDCAQYRSLVLMDRNIQDGVLHKWVAILLAMLLIFKLQAYCMIKVAIMLRR